MQSERTEGSLASGAGDEIRCLKRNMHVKELDFAKDKAILEQKIELLQLELQESKDREQKTKQHYEKVTDLLNGPDKRAGEREALLLEGCAQKAKYEQVIAELEETVKELQMNLREKENELSFMKIDFERKEIALERDRLKVDSEKKEFERKLRKGEDDRETVAERMEMTIEKMKIDHAKELEQVRSECELQLQDVVAGEQQEREKLTLQIQEHLCSLLRSPSGFENLLQ